MDRLPKYQPLHHYIVILCGGTGPRLWPLSRARNPKPFLNLLSNRSLLQQTYDRARKIVPAQNVYLITNKKYVQKVKNLLPTKNIIAEPEKKNTAMAMIFASSIINRLDPNSVITFLPSDHYISNLNLFRQDLIHSSSLALNNQIVIIGIHPLSPNPSYGYVKTALHNGRLKVIKFIEKPTIKKAKQLILNGNCFWNAGIYTFTPSTIFAEFSKHQKEYQPILQHLVAKQTDYKTLKHLYHLSPNLSIDYAIAEKSVNISLIKASFSWSDIGEWKAIYALLPHDQLQNSILNRQTEVLAHNSSHCLIHSPHKLVGLVGVRDLAVIDTPDALLICHLDQSFEVRQLIGQMVNNPKKKHFFTS